MRMESFVLRSFPGKNPLPETGTPIVCIDVLEAPIVFLPSFLHVFRLDFKVPFPPLFLRFLLLADLLFFRFGRLLLFFCGTTIGLSLYDATKQGQ